MNDTGRTWSIPYCDECPPVQAQSVRGLVNGVCDRCGWPLGQEARIVRELRARRLIAEWDGRNLSDVIDKITAIGDDA